MVLAHTPTQKGSKFFKVKDHMLFTVVIPAPDTEPGCNAQEMPTELLLDIPLKREQNQLRQRN